MLCGSQSLGMFENVTFGSKALTTVTQIYSLLAQRTAHISGGSSTHGDRSPTFVKMRVQSLLS